ncbi:hypothetical protein ACFQY5_41320 [Paeniroseomonas aquatica]|uniref:CinA C-terminal domain-containing protein n=1 Tax=Paeniroseomonas aquatica TaxID=373043 RepID=A0ABT8AFP4_9PROT|nr:hypothetical protein [Paeniroseomonas aquatica]MDN3568658.1 hypothetical protein [Paeniroseomonas aquatica]
MMDATSLPEDAGQPVWRITATSRCSGAWLAAVTLVTGKVGSTVLHVARVAEDGRVWLPASWPAELRTAVAPAVAEAARVLLAEGRG